MKEEIKKTLEKELDEILSEIEYQVVSYRSNLEEIHNGLTLTLHIIREIKRTVNDDKNKRID